MFFENAPDSRIDTKGLQESGAHHKGRVHAEEISDLKSAQFFRQTSAWGKILVMAREGEIIRLRRIPDRRIFFSPEWKKNWRNFFFRFFECQTFSIDIIAVFVFVGARDFRPEWQNTEIESQLRSWISSQPNLTKPNCPVTGYVLAALWPKTYNQIAISPTVRNMSVWHLFIGKKSGRRLYHLTLNASRVSLKRFYF